jgi:hypothetical protein
MFWTGAFARSIMSSPFDPRLTALINPDLLLEEPERFSDVPSWHEHIPFAPVLMELLKPRNFVELGAHKGDSYFAFCQAASRLDLQIRCYAVDTWHGDVHTKAYDETVYTEFKAWHDRHYAAFSTPLRMTFDDAAVKFENGSIDLLHIDGTHTYEAVKHDFETWLPKMSERGVVLFHDANVRSEPFGVWKLWAEISVGRPHFEFLHGNGLGVLVTGTELPGKFREFLELAQAMPDAVRTLFEAFGQRVARLAKTVNQAARIVAFENERDELHKLFPVIDRLNDELQKLSLAHTTLIGQRESLQTQLLHTQAELSATRGELSGVYASNSWKITAPLRRLVKAMRRG